MNEKDEQVINPYRKPELAFENTPSGLHLVGCSRRDKAKENPAYYRCCGCNLSKHCTFRGISLKQAEGIKEVDVTKIFNGKSLVHSILSKLKKK